MRGTEMSPPTATQTLSSLGNGRTYRWRVRAENSSGDGAWAFGTGTPVLALHWNLATNTASEGTAFGQRIQTGTQAAISGTLSYAVGDTNPASLSADLQTGYPTTFSASAGDTYLNMPQIPTVDDSVNEEDETFKVTINAGTGYTVGTPATITVTITDDDPPAAPSGLSLTAGAQKLAVSWSKPVGPVAGYQLRYKTTAAMDQTATTAGDPSTGWVTTTQFNAVSTDITSLTNGTAYDVQVRATDGQTASGNGWGDWSASQSGTPAATPTAGVTVSTTSVSVVAGSTTTYTIKLNKAPTADVVVTPTSGTTGVATVSGGLTFTSTNWSRTQNVTVTGVTAGTSTITHAATSTDTAYQGISIASVTATVTAATQTAPTTLTLTTNAASNTIAENGGSVTVTATLNRAATTAVSVTLTATGTATGTADYSLPSAFTIAVGQTSATGTVTIVNDKVDEDNETIILTTTVSGLSVTGVTLTVTDDDTAGVTVSETSRSVAKGATTTYTVVLDSKPTANVVVGATSGTTAAATVSPASRTFTPTNWNTPQTFTVAGVDVGSSTITHAVTTSTDPKYPTNLSIASVTATVTVSPGITVSSSAVGVIDGSTEVYTVKLNTAPTANVTITPTSGTTGVATVSPATLTFTSTNWSMAQEVTITGVTAGTSTITHAASSTDTNYGSSLTLDSVTATVLPPSTLVGNTGQTVASAALQTLQGDTDFSNSFTTGSHSDGYTVTSVDVRISVNRQTMLNASELAALSVALYTNSGGNPGTKVADLTTPSSVAGGASIVNFTAPAGTHLSASTTYHLQIEGAGDQVAAIRVQRTSSDDEDSGGAAGWSIGNTARGRVVSSWAARTPAAAISFAVKGGARQPMYAAGTPGVTVSETTRATEIGATTTYTVVLDSQPTASVTVTPTSGATATATVSPATLTFTTTNWDRPQTVTVTGVAAASTTITHAATSTDTRYNSISIASVSVTVSASTKTVKFDPTTVSVNEGSNASVTVKLGRNAPSGGVALAFTYSYAGSTATTADTGTTPATLTIASGQNTGTLSIPTTSDALVEGDETFTVTVTTSTAGWEVVSGQNTATVTITDDDDNNAKIGFGASGQTTKRLLTVAENVTGGTLTVPIAISHNPQSDITVAVTVETGGTATEYASAQSPGDFRIQTKSVTFTPTGSRTQNLTITVTDDALLEENQTIELKISDSGSGLGTHYTRHAMGRLARVTITDDDRTGAKVAFGTNVDSTSNYTPNVDEDVTGGTLNVPVIINRIPESSITIPVTVLTTGSNLATEGTDYSITTKSVTFGPSDTLSSGTVSKNLVITITDDSLVEEDQAIRLRIGDNTSTQLGRHYARSAGGRQARVTIEDDEADEAKIVIGNNAQATSESPVTATETDANITVNVPVTISAKPESNITIPITVVSQGTTATSADYTITTSSVTFGPGSSDSTTQNLAVTVRGDELVEEDQKIILRIGDTSSGLRRFYARHATSRQTTFTIQDDERPAAKIAFGTNASSTSSYTPTAVDENDGTINVPITITDLPESNTHFTVEVLAASTATEWTNAQNPGDYQVLGNKTVTFRPTDSGKTQNVRIQLQNNALVEHPETVQLRIVAARASTHMDFDLGDHYARNAQSRLATLTINDDDAAAAKIALGTNAASTMKFTRSVDEDVTNGTYKIPIRVSHSPSVDTTFEIEVLTGGAAGTATSADYSIGTKTFTITPTTNSATVDVTITNDQWVEDDQTIEVRIKAADTSGTTLEKYYTRDASGSLGTITIEDDEQRAARIAFGTAARTTRYTANGEEVVGTLNVPIAINHLPESSTTFTVEVLSTSTARETDDPTNAMGNPKDFVIGTKTVTFTPTMAKSMNLAIAIENDDVEEDDEYLDLRIVAKDNPVDDLGDHYDRHAQGSTARVTVKSEDAVGAVAFTTNITGTAGVQAGDILLFEGQNLVVTATTDKYVGPGGWAVALALRGWRTSITASPNDVQLPTFTIPEGAKSATGTITIVTDTRTEQQELFHFGGNAKRKGRTIQASPQWTRARITDSGAGLTLNTASLAPLEAEALTYTVKLNQAPTADVTVTPATSSAANATVSGALTFTSTNWQTAQPVTVTGVADGKATISHTVTSTDSSYTNLSNLPSVSVDVQQPETKFTVVVKETGESRATAEEGGSVELELTLFQLAGTSGEEFTAQWTAKQPPITRTAGVTVSHTALTVAESGTGNTAAYTVRLNSRPTAGVTVTPATSSSANATVSGALTFTPSNWNTPQEFTVTGVATGSATITHAATSTDTSYDGATVGGVTVTVAANAVAPTTLTLSTNAPMNKVAEGGSLLVIATLDQPAASDTTVTLTATTDSTAGAADYGTLPSITIAAGKTSGTGTLSITNDTVYDGASDETIVLTTTVSGLTVTDATITIVDDEESLTATVASGERRKTLTIQLPDDDVPSVRVERITVAVSHATWTVKDAKGRVTISYTDDDGGEATVAFGSNAAPGNAYQATVAEDVSGGTLEVPVTISAAAAEALEFTVLALPDGTARAASSAAACANGQGDFHIANRKVTIPSGATSAMLTITICDDDLGEPDETIRLGFTRPRTPARSVEDLYARKPAGTLQAVITIDSEDVPTSVRLAGGSIQDATVTEGGQVEVTATLDRPADQGGVTVTLTLKSGVASTATSADYRLPPAFTIPAGETRATAVVRFLPDEVVDGEKVLRLTATTSPSLTVTFATRPNPALATNVLLNRQYVEIVIRDADSPGLNLSRSSLAVAAGQQSEPYTVRLNSRPTANVTVALAVDPAANAAVSPTTLTFTTQNWRTPQEVRVRARTVGSATITATATSTDANYNGPHRHHPNHHHPTRPHTTPTPSASPAWWRKPASSASPSAARTHGRWRTPAARTHRRRRGRTHRRRTRRRRTGRRVLRS